MPQDNPNLKYFAGYAAWREYRWGRHHAGQKDKPDVPIGVIGWCSAWLMMTALGVGWMGWSWGVWILPSFGLVWIAVGTIATIAGVREAREQAASQRHARGERGTGLPARVVPRGGA